MTKRNAWREVCAAFLLCAATAIAAPAQTFTTLFTFDGDNGAQPEGALVQGADGNLYGTTLSGGRDNCVQFEVCGTVFRVTRTGGLKGVLLNDGQDPMAGLVLGTDRDFYGTTYYGGDNSSPCAPEGCGTIFKIAPGGKQTLLHNFDSTDGANPALGSLIQVADGNFYGATELGGAGTCSPGLGEGCGTVFKIRPNGTLVTLHAFNVTDGAYPQGSLVQATNGSFYGTTTAGGSGCSAGCGTVFKITSDGTLTTLHAFDSTDGAFPFNTLIQATDGNLYGVTHDGGNTVATCGSSGCGTIFRMTPKGTLTTVYAFCSVANCADGYGPRGLVQASDGNFYGATGGGGANNVGTLFKVSAEGLLTTLHDFDFPNGAYPYVTPIQATDGSFYGTTTYGGLDDCNIGCGTVFNLSVGLGPFVSFVRNPARVGQTFGVLGQGLTGTANVSLNGISASFTVVSDTLIKATVPAGATTGYVTVTTPSGTLTSNVPFHVIR